MGWGGNSQVFIKLCTETKKAYLKTDSLHLFKMQLLLAFVILSLFHGRRQEFHKQCQPVGLNIQERTGVVQDETKSRAWVASTVGELQAPCSMVRFPVSFCSSGASSPLVTSGVTATPMTGLLKAPRSFVHTHVFQFHY